MNARSLCARRRIFPLALMAVVGWLGAGFLRADCSLTNVGITPLPDLGFGLYQGHTGGLYPGGANQSPASHEAAGLELAEAGVRPRDAAGQVETNSGKIVLLSIGMSNTTQEWASKGTNNFRRLANADPSKDPRVLIVDGAQGGQAATEWTNANAEAWLRLDQRLANANVTSNQVQVLWIKLAERRPGLIGAFPVHALEFKNHLAVVVRIARSRFAHLKIAYLSTRIRAYTDGADLLNPEPFAFESGFSVQWLIADQIHRESGLNYEPAHGPVVAPWLAWGPYLWADGTTPRSDGFTWLCSDLESDFTHPSTNGVARVAIQLLAFFKTDPTATPWFLRQSQVGQPPVCAPEADVTHGLAPLAVRFTANASDPDGSVVEHLWTFDDGTFATNANPVKQFPAPGVYRARLTAMDNTGNTVSGAVTVTVTTTLAAWRQARFTPAELANPAVSGDDADLDGDGIANKFEYAFGLDPRVADPPAAARPQVAVADDRLLLTYWRSRIAANVTFALDVSEDLASWSAPPGLLELIAAEPNGLAERVTYRLNRSLTETGQAFVRLSVIGLP